MLVSKSYSQISFFCFDNQSDLFASFVKLGFRNVGLLGKIFLMEQCNGQESQFFYLDAVDYSDEMAEYKAKLMM